MSDIDILDRLVDLGLDIPKIPTAELSQFLDLVQFIKEQDYHDAVDFVLTRKNLELKTPVDKFKYLCGYLQKTKKIYHYKKLYENKGNTY